MKHNKFSKFIEHILVCLPLLFLGISSAYVVFNKNAKDSYDDTFVRQEKLLSLPNTLNDNFDYKIIYDSTITSGNTNQKIAYSDISVDWYELGASSNYVYNRFYIQVYGTAPSTMIYLYEEGNEQPVQSFYNMWGFSLFEFSFTHVGSQNIGQGPFNVYTQVLEKRTLNNVLPYAMGEFNKLGFGKIPFTSFFTGIFMNGETNVYVEFVNSYLNYFLFVECTYFLPMVIYWFIHFGERLVDKFTNKEF